MNHVIMFSGGVGSWAAAKRVAETHGTADLVLLFADVLAALQATEIRQQRMYDMGFPHANCGGGCVKAGIAHWLHLLKMMPDRYAWWEQQEQDLRTYLGKDVSILRDRGKGGKCKPCKGAGMIGDTLCDRCDGTGKATRPLTLKELRENTPLQADLFDWGGCGCFMDVVTDD